MVPPAAPLGPRLGFHRLDRLQDNLHVLVDGLDVLLDLVQVLARDAPVLDLPVLEIGDLLGGAPALDLGIAPYRERTGLPAVMYVTSPCDGLRTWRL